MEIWLFATSLFQINLLFINILEMCTFMDQFGCDSMKILQVFFWQFIKVLESQENTKKITKMSFKTLPSSNSIRADLTLPSSEQINILSQIEKRKQKLQEYAKIENQLNFLQKDMATSKKIKEDGVSTVRTAHKIYERPKHANKQIRIYELQRKLAKLRVEYHQKREIGDLLNSEIETEVGEIIKIESSILKETQTEQEFTKEIYQCEQTIKSSQQQVRNLNLEVNSMRQSLERYEFQAKQLRDVLFKRSLVAEQQKKLAISIIQSREETVDLNLTPSICETEYFCIYSQSNPRETGFSEHSTLFADPIIEKGQAAKRIRIKLTEEQFFLKKTGKEEDLQTAQFLRDQKQEFILQLKNEINYLLASGKHRKTTLDLFTKKINLSNENTAKISQQIKGNEICSQQLAKRIGSLQGSRGQLRAKLGMAVEQSRLIFSVNLSLNHDTKIVQMGISDMKEYWERISVDYQLEQ